MTSIQEQNVTSKSVVTTVESFHEVGQSAWRTEEVIGVVFISLIMPAIIGGNTCVIVAVIRFRRLQIPTNYFLLSLAVADIFTGVLVPFTIAVEVNKVDITNIIICLLPHCVLLTTSGVSVLCLGAIACDRYAALSKSYQYIHIITPKRIMALSVTMWVYSAAICWSPLMGWRDDIELPDKPCSFHRIHTNTLILLLSAIFLPAYLVIFYCYAKIFCIARHHARAIAAVEMSVHRTLELHCLAKDTKYAKTLAIVIGFFVMLWLPYQLCMLIEVVSGHYIEDWIRIYCAILSHCNSAVNPWIYAFRNTEFRAAFRKLFRDVIMRCRSKDIKTSVASTSAPLSAAPSVVVPPNSSQTNKVVSPCNSSHNCSLILSKVYGTPVSPSCACSGLTSDTDLQRKDTRVILGQVPYISTHLLQAENSNGGSDSGSVATGIGIPSSSPSAAKPPLSPSPSSSNGQMKHLLGLTRRVGVAMVPSIPIVMEDSGFQEQR